MHFVDRKPKGEQPRLLTPHPDTSILYSSCPDGGTGRRKGLKILDRKVVRVQSPLWAPKQNERVTIQIHTRLPFKISPFTLVVAIANANRRGFFFFPPSFLSPPPSAPQPLRTRRHVFLHTLWAGSAYFPWEVGGASRASGGHPGSLSISAG